MTRFAEISPIWQYCASFWAISESLNLYLAKNTVFGKLLCFWVIFYCCKWPNSEKLSTHLVTLQASLQNWAAKL